MSNERSPRMTIPTQLVLQCLLDEPGREMYGAEMGSAAGLPSGTIHPILARLEGVGWVVSRWEDIDVHAAGRPQRRYYRLTADGAVAARRALARAYRGNPAVRARPIPGAP